jgi:hypothetical protein
MYIFRRNLFIMKRLSTLILLSVIIGSCHNAPGPAYVPLTATSIYFIDSVRMALGGDEKAARKLLDQAADLYKKGPDTAQSIELFKQSILVKPTARAYYELAGALVTTHQYTEAIQALHVAEKLGYSPLSNVMYRYALAYCNLSRGGAYGDSTLYFMELAIQMGYPRPQQFLRRDLFPVVYARVDFDDVYNKALVAGSGHDKSRALWDVFKSHFFPIQLPLVIDEQWIKGHQKGNNDVSYEFSKFIPLMQDDHWEREPDNMYYYAGLITENPTYSAVLYSIEPTEEEAADTTHLIAYYLASFTNKGDIIDTLQVAGAREAMSPFKVFSIQPSLQFSVQDFVSTPDSTASGSDTALVIHRSAVPPVEYRIAANGKFERIDALTFR